MENEVEKIKENVHVEVDQQKELEDKEAKNEALKDEANRAVIKEIIAEMEKRALVVISETEYFSLNRDMWCTYDPGMDEVISIYHAYRILATIESKLITALDYYIMQFENGNKVNRYFEERVRENVRAIVKVNCDFAFGEQMTNRCYAEYPDYRLVKALQARDACLGMCSDQDKVL